MGPPSYVRSVVDRNVVMRRIPVSITQVSMYDIWATVSRHTWPTFPWNRNSVLQTFSTTEPKVCEYVHTMKLHSCSIQHESTNAQRFIRNNCLFLTISRSNNYALTHSWKQKTKRQTSLMPTTGVRHGWINSVSHRCFMTHLSTIRVNAIFTNTSWSSQRPLSKMPNLSTASTTLAATVCSLNDSN